MNVTFAPKSAAQNWLEIFFIGLTVISSVCSARWDYRLIKSEKLNDFKPQIFYLKGNFYLTITVLQCNKFYPVKNELNINTPSW